MYLKNNFLTLNKNTFRTPFCFFTQNQYYKNNNFLDVRLLQKKRFYLFFLFLHLHLLFRNRKKIIIQKNFNIFFFFRVNHQRDDFFYFLFFFVFSKCHESLAPKSVACFFFLFLLFLFLPNM